MSKALVLESKIHTEQYVLDFAIKPDLYRHAITQPIPGHEQPKGGRLALRTGLAIVAMTGSITFFCLAFFDINALVPMTFGFFLGAAIVLGIWWRQHRRLVRVHMTVNTKTEKHHYVIDAKGIIAQRAYIRSEIEWPFVTCIRHIEGATLIDVQTARLIVPDTALNVSPEEFQKQMEIWRTT